MSIAFFKSFFYIDILSQVIISLVSFIGTIVYIFSRKYMKGDSLYQNFLCNILILLLSVICMAINDNLLLFLIAWYCCNSIIVKLMIHTSTWKAAQASGNLAHKNFIIGLCSITAGFAFMYNQTGSSSIQYNIQHLENCSSTSIALFLLLIGAIAQSAIFPFHRWLISSLNSPTPVSAIMHAGVINAGGFLLIRFAPIYLKNPALLTIMFILGLLTALLGSFWKLMQHDIKRMLAYSTIAQMGFMLMQCGLGNFSSAIAHLCWHGMFKAYLFLNSGSAAQEKKFEFHYPPTLTAFLISLIFGIAGTSIFAKINSINLLSFDTTLFILGIACITLSQLALTILGTNMYKNLPTAIIYIPIIATIYGMHIYIFDRYVSSLQIMQPQPINILHVIGLILLTFTWLLILCIKKFNNISQMPNLLLKIYVTMLNASQPNSSTITTYRNAYDYKK